MFTAEKHFSKSKINYHKKKNNIQESLNHSLVYYDNTTTHYLIHEYGLKGFTNKILTNHRFKNKETIVQLDSKSNEKIIEHLSKHVNSIHKI